MRRVLRRLRRGRSAFAGARMIRRPARENAHRSTRCRCQSFGGGICNTFRPPHFQTVRHYGLYTSAKKAAYEQCCEQLKDRQPPVPTSDTAPESSLSEASAQWLRDHTCPTCGQPLIVTAYIPSSLTGKVIPRPPLGSVPARPPTPGGAHAS